MKRVVLSIVLAGLPFASFAQQPAPPVPPPLPQGPTLRASVDQVVVDVVVTDAEGKIVTGLTAADFELRDRGTPQAVATFSEVSLPLTIRGAGAPLAAPGDIRSNTQGEGRLYVLVLDDFHIGVDLTTLVRETGREFLRRHVQPGDFVAVVGTGGLGGTRREFTADLVRADAAIQTFIGRGSGGGNTRPQSAGRNVDRMAARQTSGFAAEDPTDDASSELVDRARVSFDTLRRTADALASVPGRRKTVLFFSEGIAIPPRDDHGLAAELQAVLTAAARANVAVYTFDPRGLRHINPDGLGGNGAEVSAAVLADNRTRILRAATLHELAERSGGGASVDTNDTLALLARVAHESSHYYLLGYTPTDARRDGRFHSLDVRVRRPGLRVAARRGYVAPDDDRHAGKKQSEATGPLADLIRRPVPTAGLALAAQAIAFPAAAGNVAVIVEVDATDRAGRSGSAEPSTVDLVFQPVHIGRPPIAAVEARLALPSAADGQAATERARIVQRLTLPPGDYQIRIAARESGGEEGAVICEVEVPDTKARGLAISGVVVGTTHGGRLPSAVVDAPLTQALGGRPPSLDRSFARDETLSAYAEVIDAGAGAPRDVALVTIVRDSSGRDVVRSAQPRANARVGPGEPFAYAVDLPLKALAPGAYLLRVEAQAAGLAGPVAREVPFTVAPSP
ncbi:MAG: VWA domain-containing protein [Vicinamibacteria bacterium]